MMVCHCTTVNDRTIRSCIADGATDLHEIGSRCGAGTVCGGCTPELARLLVESGRAGASISPQPVLVG